MYLDIIGLMLMHLPSYLLMDLVDREQLSPAQFHLPFLHWNNLWD